MLERSERLSTKCDQNCLEKKSNPNESKELKIQQQTPTIILRTEAVKEAISKLDYELKVLDYEVFEITYSC